MDESPRVDVHAHLIPRDALEALARLSPEHAPRLDRDAGGHESLLIAGGRIGGLSEGLLSIDAAVADAAEHEIDRLVLSTPPFLFFYALPPGVARDFCHVQNNAMARAVRAWPGRADALAQLPLQAPQAAAEELRRAVRHLGLKGAVIGTHVGGVELDAPELEPVWAEAEALNVPIFVHPHDPAGRERMQGYHLRNLIGSPLDTTLAAARLIFGGVAERHPRLRFLLAHCGGYLPFALGRLEHGYTVRPEVHRAIPVPPSEYLHQFWLDTIIHDTGALRYAIDTFGEGHLVLGTDYPFDMADPHAVEHVTEAPWLTDGARRRILGGNAHHLFGLT